MENLKEYKKEFFELPITQIIIQSIKNNNGLTRAEILKITGFSLATIYGKYIPRMIEYNILTEKKGITGIRTLFVTKEIKQKEVIDVSDHDNNIFK